MVSCLVVCNTISFTSRLSVYVNFFTMKNLTFYVRSMWFHRQTTIFFLHCQIQLNFIWCAFQTKISLCLSVYNWYTWEKKKKQNTRINHECHTMSFCPKHNWLTGNLPAYSIQIELPWKFVNKMLFFRKVYFLLVVGCSHTAHTYTFNQWQIVAIFFLSCESCYLYELHVQTRKCAWLNKR